MPIIYDEKNKVFNLQTKNSSYVMGIFKEKYLLHFHYGKKINSLGDMMDVFPTRMGGNFSAEDDDSLYSTDALAMEYPCYGSADLRTPAFHAKYQDGSTITKLEYSSYRIYDGKPELKGLPATYVESDDEAQTLEITLCDSFTGLNLILMYTVFNNFDAIAKSVKVINKGTQKIELKSVISSTVNFFDKEFDFVHLYGDWARERHIQKVPVMNGIQGIDSKRVSSSHHHNPFFALARKGANEEMGDVYGFSFVYSGNFVAQTDTNSFNTVRANIGINPFNFGWTLESGEEFQSPEVVMVYSGEGFGKMSRTYHKLYRTRLCRGAYRDAERPILINNWEATYFDFNEEKILSIAKKAQSVGVELMVLDDGWFGKRNDDTTSLGDWVVDRNKLPNGIDGLAEKVTALGMKFGLWFEPEMVSPDSDLYRAHPEWSIHVNGRQTSTGRHQYVLDLSRPDVCDYIIKAVSDVLKSAPISYVKWDMNRNITELGSDYHSAEKQQELAHRYILGVYHVLDELTKAFPDILFEGCSGGGGRFDPGMLYYSPQIWCSDDSDAMERLHIQYGTSMVYPSSSMGAHVSAVPNHQLGRNTPIEARGFVAMSGQFGYELDLSTLKEDDIEAIRGQIKTYKEIRKIIHQGDMYRLRSPFEGTHTSWEFVSEDKNNAVLFYFTMLGKPLNVIDMVCLKGLDPDAKYKEKYSGKIYSGDVLMNVGLPFCDEKDYGNHALIFERV